MITHLITSLAAAVAAMAKIELPEAGPTAKAAKESKISFSRRVGRPTRGKRYRSMQSRANRRKAAAKAKKWKS
jgi:hypothetical protein